MLSYFFGGTLQMNDTIRIHTDKAKMVAHRGVSGLELENTNSAFVAAGNRSYFGIETDVHVTADGQFICIHDDNTKRVAQDEMVVEKTTFETLRSLRLVDKDGQKGRSDLRLPSLAEYISICKKYEKQAVLELKNHMKPESIYQIIDVIDQIGWLDHTTFISFDLSNMICVRNFLPEARVQFLISYYPDWLVDTLKRNNLDLDIYYKAITPERVKELHDNGIEVNVWTVDTIEDAQYVIDCGVDYITSNILE
jgi:glycerophosphoryl diester phosphodiesterase